MAEALKCLGQLKPIRFVHTPIYTVPAAKSAVVSSIACCNQGSTPSRFRVSHAIGGAPDNDAQYVYFEELVPAKKTFIATIGLTMAATDALRVSSDTGEMSFLAYGSEVS